MHSKFFTTLALTAACSLAACGGGGAGSSTPSTGNPGGGNGQTLAEDAIAVTNALGVPVGSLSNFNSTTVPSLAYANGHYQSSPNGQCSNGIEVFVPDKSKDPNSTESQYFYDSACAQLARDSVRIFTISGSSETLNRTDTFYAAGNATPDATRTSTSSFLKGTYGQNGYPVIADGFARSSTSQLDLAGSRTVVAGDELVMAPATGSVSSFCSDSAGYNATGIPQLNKTFGWQGTAPSGGTRTLNGDGSVTWVSTHTGSTAGGAIGSLSLGTGSANVACPIATPQFTLIGGAQDGQYTIPVSATFSKGELVNLTVTNATLADGNTLNVTTTTDTSPTSSHFVTGTIANGGTPVATITLDTFGDGTLTMASGGVSYVVTDWHVIK